MGRGTYNDIAKRRRKKTPKFRRLLPKRESFVVSSKLTNSPGDNQVQGAIVVNNVDQVTPLVDQEHESKTHPDTDGYVATLSNDANLGICVVEVQNSIGTSSDNGGANTMFSHGGATYQPASNPNRTFKPYDSETDGSAGAVIGDAADTSFSANIQTTTGTGGTAIWDWLILVAGDAPTSFKSTTTAVSALSPTPSLTVDQEFVSTTTVVSTVAGVWDVTRPLISSTVALSVVTADVRNTSVRSESTTTAVSTVTPSLQLVEKFVSTTTATSALSPTPTLHLDTTFVSTTTAISTLTVDLTKIIIFDATTTALSTVTPNFEIAKVFDATTTATSTVPANLGLTVFFDSATTAVATGAGLFNQDLVNTALRKLTAWDSRSSNSTDSRPVWCTRSGPSPAKVHPAGTGP